MRKLGDSKQAFAPDAGDKPTKSLIGVPSIVKRNTHMVDDMERLQYRLR